MAVGESSPSGRRASLPPLPLHAEVVRGRVLEALGSRFEVKITVVVAGAGFGKTTALAQAIRANEASPRGIDAWVACQPGDEDASQLAAAIVTALGADPGRGDDLDRILDAVRDLAPVDVCVMIDDLHELPAMSAGDELVRRLAAELPAHAHLLLASREPVRIPLARRRAAGDVVEIGVDSLAFTDAEIAALASDLGGDAAACAGVAGWPSLVRLVLAAPTGALRQFLWEEVVAGLPASDRRGLLALATLRSGTAAELYEVAGTEFDLDHLLSSVPLLHSDAHGTAGAHELWADAVDRVFSADLIAQTRARALAVLHDRGQTLRLGSAAIRWHDAPMFQRACRALVVESLGALPIDTAARWLAGAPMEARGTGDVELLEIALRHARHRSDDDVDAELDRLDGEHAALDDHEFRGLVLALASVIAHARGDQLRLVELAERTRALPGIGEQPLLTFLVDAVDAALSSLVGDVAGALARLDKMSYAGVPPLVRELVTRLHVVMLVLAGRADEAVSIGASLDESPHAYVRTMPAMLRWLSGDPSEQLSTAPVTEIHGDLNHRDRFVRAAHGLAVAASLGDVALARTMRRELDATVATALDARDSAITAVAAAQEAILAHDEPAAARAIADHLARHPLDDRLGEAHLRRWLAIGFVCSETARRRWIGDPLGPLHRQVAEVATTLIELRDGRTDGPLIVPRAPLLITALPLAWSVELAVRLWPIDRERSTALADDLVALVPGPARRELEWWAAGDEADCTSAAIALLAALPPPDRAALQVDVLGPMRLRVGPIESAAPELRRSRVRSLLGLLVLRGPLRRDRIAGLLWPDLDPAAAAQNLRVTLSRLRRALDGAPAGGTTSRLRVTGDVVALAPSPAVATDLELVAVALADADRARPLGAAADEVAALQQMMGLWRGDPLDDLAGIDELRGEIEFLHQSLVAACLRLGELELVAGRVDEALRCADRGRLASPYSERAHRLAIACHLQRRDTDRLLPAVRAAHQLFDDLGVEPEPATEMLLRRASFRLGQAGDGPGSPSSGGR